MKNIAIAACLILSFNTYASDCVKNARGHTVCNNGQEAVGRNPNTGTAFKSEKNEAGVTTTQTNRGGEAKTKNGKGVYKAPGGKTCVKGATAQGCN